MVTVIGLKPALKSLHSLNKGIARHGDKFLLLESSNEIVSADAFIQTNLLKPKFESSGTADTYRYILQSQKPFLVSESPSFRRYPNYSRLGWYSYKWTEGIFGNENAPSDRWNQFVKDTGIKIKDWNSPGDHILIMCQKEGDSSLQNLYKKYESFYDWVEETVIEIRKYTDRKIIVRPHPRNLKRGLNMAKKLNKKKNLNIIVSENVKQDPSGRHGGESLDLDLQKAYCVITYNSLSAIEAICEGVPTFALENGSMIWPIAHKNLSEIENLNYNIDVKQWCNEIAYTQWTVTENRKGISWEHLKPLMFKDL